MNLKICFITACLVIPLFMMPPLMVTAQTPPPPLSPEARVAFDKGMAAVEQKEWLVAADSFNKAWKINKQSLYPEKAEPEIVFNWGLAESKIPGRELRAITCFNLYLNVAEKDAANAGAVRKEKAALEVRQEARLRKLIVEAKKFVAQFGGDNEFRRHVAAGGYDLSKSIASLRRPAYRRVAHAQAMAGDFTGAMQTAELAKIPAGINIASGATLGAQGDYHGADEALLKEIADLQAKDEKPQDVGRSETEMNRRNLILSRNLRELLLSSNFNKVSLTDPTGTLQALADKRKPEDLFDGYMQVIEEMIFVLRRVTGQRTIYYSP